MEVRRKIERTIDLDESDLRAAIFTFLKASGHAHPTDDDDFEMNMDEQTASVTIRWTSHDVVDTRELQPR